MSAPGVASSGCASGLGSKDFLDNWGPGVRQSCVGMVTPLFSGAALGTRGDLLLLFEGANASPEWRSGLDLGVAFPLGCSGEDP